MSSLSRIFGAIRQNGYVVRDLEAAMQHWTEKLGVGPFFVLDRMSDPSFRYRGEPTAAVVSLALANSGPLQIELIQQHDDEPSVYREFLDAGREGLHHVGVYSERMDDDLDRLAAAGYEVVHSGAPGEGCRFVYYATEAHPGTFVELIETSGPTGALFDAVARAAQGWSGDHPIRRLG